MPRFALRFPYLVIVLCLITCVVGITQLVRMPVDLFPPIRIPVVVVATFFSGMPPEQVETDITGRFERFFTLASGVDHIESRSLPGVSLIKIYFQPGFNANAAVTSIANLALADLRKLPPGTLPPVVLKFDASSLPVCLVTLKGAGLSEARLRDLGQYDVRNQIASVPGASVPQPFGGRYRQIMVYVDPLKLQAHELSVMDVVRTVNQANLILPAGDVRIGPYDYNLYANSQLDTVDEINRLPLKTVNNAAVLVRDVGHAQDAAQIQSNIVRVDGQPSVYLPVLKQGGDANTIAVVDGIRRGVSRLLDVPRQLVAQVVFDQSQFVRSAIENLIHEGLIGLALTGCMILVFLGSMRATLAVFLSIPLSALAAFIALSFGDSTINAMILGGLALAFSRLIDNSVVVLENIFRHIENGETPAEAAERGGREVQLPVLAATLTTAIVFFPVIFLAGVSRFLFTALALAVVLSLFASYFVAMTVVPLFCARFIGAHEEREAQGDTAAQVGDPEVDPAAGEGAAAAPRGALAAFAHRFHRSFNAAFARLLDHYQDSLARCLLRPVATVVAISGLFVLCAGLYPFIGKAYFPRTDPSQFVINLKAPTGTRMELTDKLVEQVEQIVRQVVPARELKTLVSNIGTTPGFSSIYTPNSGPHTAFVQVGLKPGHSRSSFAYMDAVRQRIGRDLPLLSTYFQTGGLVDAVLNLGLPAPLDVQVSGSDMQTTHEVATRIAGAVRALPGVSDVMVPQDVDYPSLRLDIDRLHASELGLDEKEVVGNVITALTSNGMIAPSYWVDPKSGNDYLLTVQYPEGYIHNLTDLRAVPLRGAGASVPTRLDTVSSIRHIESPTEVDHYQLRREMDVYVSPDGEDLSHVLTGVERIVHGMTLPAGVRVTVRGSAEAMRSSFSAFGFGLILATLLVYLVLVAQFQSFLDPFLILLAVPTGLAGVLLILFATGTTLNIMSLMGVVMMVGIVVSNSILIVEFTRRLRSEGVALREAVALACRVRLRPVLMTSLATLIGLIPMALKIGTGTEAYAPLARAIIGGLAVSVVLTVFIVPAAYYLVHRHEESPARNVPGASQVPA
ncbi:MAG: efflux RND transporter permease subunit [Proteobacteria bacterium]|nr:efflux RND transporter permease subunit [Pseudomonadota bacterium]